MPQCGPGGHFLKVPARGPRMNIVPCGELGVKPRLPRHARLSAAFACVKGGRRPLAQPLTQAV